MERNSVENYFWGYPSDWEWKSIGQISKSIQPGFASGVHNSSGLGTPHLRPMNISIKGELDLSVVKYVEVQNYDKLLENDILFNNTNSPELVGKTTYINHDTSFAYSNHMTRIRVSPDYFPPFISYALVKLFLDGYFRQNCTNHVNQASINSSFLSNNVFIPIPSYSIQKNLVKKIEELFSQLDAAEAALKRARANLKRYRLSVLQAAVTGELTREWRESHKTLPGNSNYQKLTPQEILEEMQLSQIPNNWIWVKTSDVCESISNGSTPKPIYMSQVSGDIPFIKVYNLTNSGKLDFSINPTFITFETNSKLLRRSQVHPGDILMNIVGPPLGKVSLVPDDFSQWNINQAIVSFRVNEAINNKFLLYLLLSDFIQKRLQKTAKATAGQYNLNVSTCRNLVIPLPPLDEQKQIIQEVENLFSIIDKEEQVINSSNDKVSKLRNAILHRAFSGQFFLQENHQ